MTPKTRALLGSFGRVLGAAAVAAYLTLGKQPLELRLNDLGALFNAAVGALIVTAGNYLRAGETRFGRGSANLGMGGDDRLEPPQGAVDPKSLPGYTGTEGPGVPVQTDNTPRDEDGEQLPVDQALDQTDWTGEDMR